MQVRAGDRFKFFFHPDGIIILSKILAKRLKGSVPKLAQSVSHKEIDQATEAGDPERFRPKRCSDLESDLEIVGLDTHVLLSFLIQDDLVQSHKAAEIIEHRRTKEEPGFVSLVCILEMVWVLGAPCRRAPGNRRPYRDDLGVRYSRGSKRAGSLSDRHCAQKRIGNLRRRSDWLVRRRVGLLGNVGV